MVRPAGMPAPGRAVDQHEPARGGAHRRGRPAGHVAGRLQRQPGRDRARPDPAARGPGPRRPVHRGAGAALDGHLRLRRRGAAGHHAARAPRPAHLLRPPLHDAQPAGDAPPGEALPNTEIFRRIAAALGLDHPRLRDSDEDLARQLLGRAPASASRSCASRRTPGRPASARLGAVRRGRLPHPGRAGPAARPGARAPGRGPAGRLHAAGRGGRRRSSPGASRWCWSPRRAGSS